MHYKNYILFFFILNFSFSGFAKKIDFISLSEISQWEELIQVCEKKNQPIFLMITEYREKVNSATEFNNSKQNVKFVNQNFVSVRVSSYSKLGKTFISLFGLDADGKFIILNPQEIILLKADRISFAFFEKGLARFNNYTNLINKYEKDELTQTEWLDYLDISLYNLGYANSLRNAHKFTLTLIDDDLKNPELWDFILNYCTDLNNIVFKTIKNNPELVANPNKTFPWKQYYANVYNLNLEFAINNSDSLRMVRMTTELVPLYPDSAKWVDQKLLIEQQYYGHRNQWKTYGQITFEYLNTYATDSSVFYLKQASILYNNYTFGKVDDLIIELLNEGVEVESTYDLQMSLANIYIIKKDYALALKHANLAVGHSKSGSQKSKALNLIDYLIMYAGY